MANSTRHHFIPEFYLKAFTDPAGKFYIYEKKTGKFRGNGKRFPPKQQFFEWYGNMVKFGEVESDFIEEGFSDMDSKVAQIIAKVKVDEGATLQEEDWLLVQFFVNIMHWRIPANSYKVKEFIEKATGLKDFGMKLKRKGSNLPIKEDDEQNLFLRMKGDADFPKFLKLSMPAITFPERLNSPINDHARIMSFPMGQLPYLVSDNPIIYRQPGISSHIDEFIFPLTPKNILLRTKLKDTAYYSNLRIKIDTLLFAQAHEYVSCTEKRYPLMLNGLFKNAYKSSLEMLRENIFTSILDRNSLPVNSQ